MSLPSINSFYRAGNQGYTSNDSAQGPLGLASRISKAVKPYLEALCRPFITTSLVFKAYAFRNDENRLFRDFSYLQTLKLSWLLSQGSADKRAQAIDIASHIVAITESYQFPAEERFANALLVIQAVMGLPVDDWKRASTLIFAYSEPCRRLDRPKLIQLLSSLVEAGCDLNGYFRSDQSICTFIVSDGRFDALAWLQENGLLPADSLEALGSDLLAKLYEEITSRPSHEPLTAFDPTRIELFVRFGIPKVPKDDGSQRDPLWAAINRKNKEAIMGLLEAGFGSEATRAEAKACLEKL